MDKSKILLNMCVNDFECMCDFSYKNMDKRVNIKAKNVNVNSKKAPKPQRKAVRPRNRNTRGGVNNSVFAPVAVSNMETRGARSPPVKVIGNDEIVQVAVSKNMTAGHILVDLDLQPLSFPGASDVAKAYQFVRYIFLQVIVTSKAPTTVDGGYCLAYINDPQDSLPEGYAAVQYAKANKYCSNNFWNSGKVVCNVSPKRKFYTNPGIEGDERFNSPGKVVLLVDQPTSQDNVHLTVQVNYRMSFESKTKNYSASAGTGPVEWETTEPLLLDTKQQDPNPSSSDFSIVTTKETPVGQSGEEIPSDLFSIFESNPESILVCSHPVNKLFADPGAPANMKGQQAVAGFRFVPNAKAPVYWSDTRLVAANLSDIGGWVMWREPEEQGKSSFLWSAGTKFSVVVPPNARGVRESRNPLSLESRALMQFPDGSIRSMNSRNSKLRSLMNLSHSLKQY